MSVGRRTYPCRAEGCQRTRGQHEIVCPPHWYKVPQDLRQEVWHLYRTAPGSPAHARSVIAVVQYLRDHETPSDPKQRRVTRAAAEQLRDLIWKDGARQVWIEDTGSIAGFLVGARIGQTTYRVRTWDEWERARVDHLTGGRR